MIKKKQINNVITRTCRLIIGAVVLLWANISFAQWSYTSSGKGIYYKDGNVGIGTSSPSKTLEVTGDAYIVGSLTTPKMLYSTSLDIKCDGCTTSLLRGHTYSSGSTLNHNVLAINSSADNATLENTKAVLVVNGLTRFAQAQSDGTFTSINSDNLGNFNVWIEGGLITDELSIATTDKWADYVFDEGYKLWKLDSVETFVRQNKHLPGIASAEEVREKGYYDAGDLAIKLLEKVEELTLYTIQQDKEIDRLLQELDTYKRNSNPRKKLTKN